MINWNTLIMFILVFLFIVGGIINGYSFNNTNKAQYELLENNMTICEAQLDALALSAKAEIVNIALEQCLFNNQPAVISLTEQGIRVDCYVEGEE